MGSFDELSHGACRTKLGVTVTLGAPSGDHVSAPVLHHAKTVSENRVGRIAIGHIRTPVREFVAELGYDPHHVIQHLVQHEEIVIDRDHPYILAYRLRRGLSLVGSARALAPGKVDSTDPTEIVGISPPII